MHHDLWDYDTAAQPLLATLHRNGVEMPVVIQGNKTGNLFVLDRETGKPVFGVEERLVPKSEAEGEETSPTQPFPIAPPPLVPQRLSADGAWDRPRRIGTGAASRWRNCDRREFSRRRACKEPSHFRGTSAA